MHRYDPKSRFYVRLSQVSSPAYCFDMADGVIYCAILDRNLVPWDRHVNRVLVIGVRQIMYESILTWVLLLGHFDR